MKALMEYKATCNGKEIVQRTTMAFDQWKYKVAIDKLKPNGSLVRFYINGAEQRMNDRMR